MSHYFLFTELMKVNKTSPKLNCKLCPVFHGQPGYLITSKPLLRTMFDYNYRINNKSNGCTGFNSDEKEIKLTSDVVLYVNYSLTRRKIPFFQVKNEFCEMNYLIRLGILVVLPKLSVQSTRDLVMMPSILVAKPFRMLNFVNPVWRYSIYCSM